MGLEICLTHFAVCQQTCRRQSKSKSKLTQISMKSYFLTKILQVDLNVESSLKLNSKDKQQHKEQFARQNNGGKQCRINKQHYNYISNWSCPVPYRHRSQKHDRRIHECSFEEIQLGMGNGGIRWQSGNVNNQGMLINHNQYLN